MSKLTNSTEVKQAANHIISEIEKTLDSYENGLDSLKNEEEYKNLDKFLDTIIEHCESAKDELAIDDDDDEGDDE